jgi:hypothetical protein
MLDKRKFVLISLINFALLSGNFNFYYELQHKFLLQEKATTKTTKHKHGIGIHKTPDKLVIGRVVVNIKIS